MSDMAGLTPRHFLWDMHGSVAAIRLARPERKNPLTFDSYAELRDTFRALTAADDVDAVVILSNGGNFCSGGDMGACAMLPRIIGQGRAAELLYTGRTMRADEGERWGFYNRLVAADALEAEALDLAQRIAAGPTFAHGITKTQLNQEWSMGLEQAIEAEAQAQAICMQTRDFERAYRAFVAKQQPVFEGD